MLFGGAQDEHRKTNGRPREPMKYLPSAIGVGQMSGSAGSTTASRNRNGSYLRNRVSPVNPRSPAQSANRNSFGGFSQGWRGLTDAQRAGWVALGVSMTHTDSLGVVQTFTGLAAYISVNQTLFILGAAAVTTAPTFTSPAALTSITITATSV